MSNSQEQSLDENAVFMPLYEMSPRFLHSEKERQAIESLMSDRPESFHSFIGTEHSHGFLSSNEITQITSWVEDYCPNQLQEQLEENVVKSFSKMEDLCSTYFPSYSDITAPELELGWPEKSPCVQKESITVHTSPPAEGQPSVREIIRRHLQNAIEVIAVVTDGLTDATIIADLHTAASRGVPVYIILNQRSIQENVNLRGLRHPNMQVRALGGRTFCSRMGRMVVGEMKDKFLLVDLETVIIGSYSFTWTDAHLHRQLITVLQGPVVDSFDREFRILFAASLPVPHTWRAAGSFVQMSHQEKVFFDRPLKKRLSFESEISDPPSPPADSFLDWESMGVVKKDTCFPDSLLDQHEEIVPREMLLQNTMLSDKNTPVIDGFTNTGNEFLNMKRQLSVEMRTRVDNKRIMRLDDEATEPTQNTTLYYNNKSREVWNSIVDMEETHSRKKTHWKKPIILSMQQNTQGGATRPSGLFRKDLTVSVSALSQSMVDLSVLNTDSNHDEREVRGPQLKTNFLQGTPAQALMKQRTNDLYRPRPRPNRIVLNKELRTPVTLRQEEQDEDS